MATGMMGTSELRHGRLFGGAAQRVTLRCRHGDSTLFLLPGRDPTANASALDILWIRHIGRHGCECERTRFPDHGARVD